MRSRQLLAFAFAAVAVMAASVAARAESAVFSSPDLGALDIATDGGRVSARVAPKSQAAPSQSENVPIDRRLTNDLHRASDLVAVAGHGFSEGGRTFFVLGAAFPSVERQGGGYCGAGTEDYLLLVELKSRPRALELRDRIQVQSCLQSMALQSDQGSELRVVLRGVDDPEKIVLTWLQHPHFGPATKTLTSATGKFVVSP